MSEFFIVSLASLSTLYSPRGVKKSDSCTSSGQTPLAIRTVWVRDVRQRDAPWNDSMVVRCQFGRQVLTHPKELQLIHASREHSLNINVQKRARLNLVCGLSKLTLLMSSPLKPMRPPKMMRT